MISMAADFACSGSDHNSTSIPLLMEHTSSSSNQDRLVVNVDSTRPTPPITPYGVASNVADVQEGTSSSRQAEVEGASSLTPRTNISRASDSRRYRRRQRTSPLNSGLWISIEFTITVSQIVASIIVLILSRNEKPQTPLFAWVIGYATGCVATLPHLYWRYTHRYVRASEQDPSSTVSTAHSIPSSTQSQNAPYTAITIPQASHEDGEASSQAAQNNSDSVSRDQRVGVLIERFKMALDCFFAVWFVVGNVWIFGSHSSARDAPNLYRLCIVFLTFSCIGYAMPFIVCGTICCCLPCIISILGLREDQTQTRGAPTQLINSMPKYKFKEKKISKRNTSKETSGVESQSSDNGGFIAAGTENERYVSSEDAVCCICLVRYKDGDDLRELPCTHFFHVDCVDKWLKINASCPLCKHEIAESSEGMPESTGESGHQRASGNR